MKKILLIILLYGFRIDQNYAQCSCCGSTSGFSGGESGLGDLTLGRNKLMIEAAVDYRSFNGIKHQSRSQEFGVSTTTALAIASMEIGIVGIRYGLSNKASLLVQQPFFHINSESSTSKTFGDLLSLVNYRLISRTHFLIDGQLGMEWPTGQFVALANGSSISTGSGSFDPVTGLSAKFPLKNSSLRMGAFFKYTTKGYNQTYFGNFCGQQLDYIYYFRKQNSICSPDTVTKEKLKPAFSAKVQLSGEWSQMQRKDNAFIENTGAYVTLLGAGFTVSYKGYTLPVMLNVPLLQNFHGEQNNTQFRIRIGVSKII